MKTTKRARTAETKVAPRGPDSEAAILKAAIAEFCLKGFEGTRMEAVAKRAGYNKRLVYHHFTDKKGLFEAALRKKLKQRLELVAALPSALPEALVSLFEHATGDPDYLRLLQHEAVNFSKASILEDGLRKDYYETLFLLLKQRQENGRAPRSYPSATLLLGLTAMIFFPVAFPQITYLVTGKPVEDPEFQKEWKSFLVQFAEDIS